jgi:hypothetical protein
VLYELLTGKRMFDGETVSPRWPMSCARRSI